MSGGRKLCGAGLLDEVAREAVPASLVGRVNGFLRWCARREWCARAEPLVVAEARCHRLSPIQAVAWEGGERLSWSQARVVPSGGPGTVLRLARAVEERLGPVDRVGCSAITGGGALQDLARAAEDLACRVADIYEGNTIRVVIEASYARGPSWRLALQECEPIDWSLAEVDAVESALYWSARWLLLLLERLGLSPSGLESKYEVSIDIVESRLTTYEHALCYGVSLDLNKLLRGSLRVKLRTYCAPGEAEEPRRRPDWRAKGLLPGREGYWENGFQINAVDPYAMLRELCPEDVREILERTGEEVESVLESESMHRTSHAAIILRDGTIVEVNCSAYLDEHNWIKIHARSPERAIDLAKKILREHYKRKISEQSPERRKVYATLLKTLEKIQSIKELASTVEKLRSTMRAL